MHDPEIRNEKEGKKKQMEWMERPDPEGIRIAELKKEELRWVAELEEQIFSDNWTLSGLAEMAGQDRVISLGLWLTKEREKQPEKKLVGYGIVCTVLDEGDLVRLAVDKRYRQKGRGKLLLAALEKACRDKGVRALYLEVRQSNAPARSFYHRAGFQEEGIRRGFYDHPKEDGICMKKILGGKEC
ncbi:MAG: ribosomal protein S18-alanine N-acetyltransferase [Suipraeoptans intestinalis]|nr:ribosomal protein S18-alanine N-acetyltransferase [Suipraeoptans intestinalis]